MHITLVNVSWKGEKSDGNNVSSMRYFCLLFEDERYKRMSDYCLEGLSGE